MDDRACVALAVLDHDLLLNAGMTLELEEADSSRKKKRWWVRDWLLRRPFYGQYDALLTELKTEDPETFRNFIRMDFAMFDELLERLSPRIAKKNTFYRETISPGIRLAITLR